MLMWTTDDLHGYNGRRLPEEMDDWIYQIAQGNEQAFYQLYEATRSSVYSFVLSIIKNPHDAEDILQETYISVYQSAISYQSHGKPMAWLLRIARNFTFLKLRDKKKHQALSAEEMDQWLCGQYQLDQDDKLVLEAALNILSDEERQIITLHSISGLKHREIADLLNLKLTTVLSKYHRGLKKLKDAIREV